MLSGQLVPVQVKGGALSEPMHVMLNVDRVTAPVRTAVLREAKALVAESQLANVMRLQPPTR